MSLSTIYANVLDLLGIHDGITAVDAKRRIRLYVNRRQKQIAAKTNWRALLASDTVPTVSGQRLYSLASNVSPDKQLAYIENQPDQYEMDFISDAEFRMAVIAASSGPPRGYRLFGQDASGNTQIQLDPNPASVQTLYYEYFKIPASLVIITDVSFFDETILEQFAYADYLRYDKQDTQWKEEYGFAAEMLTEKVALNAGYVRMKFGGHGSIPTFRRPETPIVP